MTIDSIAADAYAAAEAGDRSAALELYTRLEGLAPGDPSWSKKVAGLCRQLGDQAGRIHALVRAAEKHDRRGEPMKGLATLKIALEIEPQHPDVKRAMSVIRHATPSAAPSRSASYARPETGEHELAVIPLIRRARTASHIGGAIVEVNAALDDPRSEPSLPVPEAVDDLDIEILPPIPLFSSLADDAFLQLLDRSQTAHHPTDTTLFRRGDRGHALYVIVDGSVDVFTDDPQTPVARLDDGTFFGEMSLFTGRARNATVVTAAPTELLVIPHDELLSLVRTDPPVLEVLVRFFRERLVTNVLATAPTFMVLPTAARQALRRSFRLLDVKRGTNVIEQGRSSPGLFLVVDGDFVVQQHVDTTQTVAHLAAGDLFGEISILSDMPAVATVLASTDSLVLGVPRAEFIGIAQRHPALVEELRSIAGQRLAALGYGSS